VSRQQYFGALKCYVDELENERMTATEVQRLMKEERDHYVLEMSLRDQQSRTLKAGGRCQEGRPSSNPRGEDEQDTVRSHPRLHYLGQTEQADEDYQRKATVERTSDNQVSKGFLPSQSAGAQATRGHKHSGDPGQAEMCAYTPLRVRLSVDIARVAARSSILVNPTPRASG